MNKSIINDSLCYSYPKKGEYIICRVVTWVSGASFGILVGKYVIHRLILNRLLSLKLFRRDQGSWMVVSLTGLVMLYCFSLIFNHIVELDPKLAEYRITNEMEINWKTFMKSVGLTSSFAHLIFMFMVVDTILQVQQCGGVYF